VLLSFTFLLFTLYRSFYSFFYYLLCIGEWPSSTSPDYRYHHFCCVNVIDFPLFSAWYFVQGMAVFNFPRLWLSSFLLCHYHLLLFFNHRGMSIFWNTSPGFSCSIKDRYVKERGRRGGVQKSPIRSQKSPTYTQKSPIYTRNSPIHTQKSPLYTQKSPEFFQRALFTIKTATHTLRRATSTVTTPHGEYVQCIAVCCSVLQCVAVCCSVLHLQSQMNAKEQIEVCKRASIRICL